MSKQQELFNFSDTTYQKGKTMIKITRRNAAQPKPVFREVHKKALDDAIARLKAVGCAFKILPPEGDEIIHDPEHLLEKRRVKVDRSDLPYGYGDLKRHYEQYIQDVKVGDVVEIPYSDTLPYAALQSSLSAHLTAIWGKGAYTTTTNKKTKMLEVLRLA